MAINLFTEYSPVISQKFAIGSKTDGVLYNRRYTFDGVQTVNVPTLVSVPLNNYTRSGLARFGPLTDMQDTIQSLTLTQEKAFCIAIDKTYNTEQKQIREAMSVMQIQMEQEVIPTVDKYRLNTFAAAATANGQQVTATLTKDNVIDALGQINVMLTNGKVPEMGRTLWIGATTANLIVMNSQFQRKGDMVDPVVISGLLGSILGMTVIVVPDSYLPTNTQAILVHGEAAVVPFETLEFRVITEDKDVAGSIVQGLWRYDAFALTSKIEGFASIIKSTTP